MHQFKHIIFDLGGVLIDWNPDYLYKKLIPEEDKRIWFFENVCTPAWNEEQDGGRSIAEATNLLVNQYPDYADLIHAFYDRWEEMLGGPIHHTVALFKQLKNKSAFSFYALTNWSAETFPRALELYDFLHWFDGRLVSGEEMTRKPFHDFYQCLLSRFNLEVSDCIFIDDNLRNILAAQELGFTCIHFTSSIQLEADLLKLKLIS